jgi:hypothetical protein
MVLETYRIYFVAEEQFGFPLYPLKSTRTAEEEECLRLINIAKEQGLYIDKSDWGKFGDRRMIPTGESIVFLSEDVYDSYNCKKQKSHLIRCASGKRGGNCRRKGMHIF